MVAAACAVPGDDDSRPVPTPEPEAAKLCKALKQRLPESVNGLDQNRDGPSSDFAADWGDPRVQLRCGVARPEILTPGSEHYDPTTDAVEVNGVAWLPEEQEDGYRFTTTDRKAYVELTVPSKYGNEVDPLTDLAEAIEQTIPTRL